MLSFTNIVSMITNILDEASHRERAAWLALTATAAAFGPYFVWMSIHPPTAPLPDLRTMATLVVAVVVQVIILVAGHIWFAVARPADARAPADERDRAIEARSIRSAYYVLISGVVMVGCVLPFSMTDWRLINAAIAVVVLAETTHYGLVVWSYRRGIHG